MDKEQYERFVEELTNAEKVILRDFEKREIFEGCMPVEVLASRGKDSLRFAMLKPVGLKDGEGKGYYAILQLRKENSEGTAYNLVGCQTNLKFGEQKRVFSMIPALQAAEFVRYGVMHRNTFINAPVALNSDLRLKNYPNVFIAGQLCGVEGYVESIATGLLAAINVERMLRGEPTVVPPVETVLGALLHYITQPNGDFQPMNANFGILPPIGGKKADRKRAYYDRSSKSMADFVASL